MVNNVHGRLLAALAGRCGYTFNFNYSCFRIYKTRIKRYLSLGEARMIYGIHQVKRYLGQQFCSRIRSSILILIKTGNPGHIYTPEIGSIRGLTKGWLYCWSQRNQLPSPTNRHHHAIDRAGTYSSHQTETRREPANPTRAADLVITDREIFSLDRTSLSGLNHIFPSSAITGGDLLTYLLHVTHDRIRAYIMVRKGSSSYY
jgi:hypothetical protein